MTKSIRLLICLHYLYLLFLPSLAVLAGAKLGLGRSPIQLLVIATVGPRVMYTVYIAAGYTIPASLPVALYLVLAAPVQIAVSVVIFGGSNGWLFLLEEAAIEIGGMCVGFFGVAMRTRYQKDGAKLFILLLILIIPVFFGGLIPYLQAIIIGYGGLSWWLILFFIAGWIVTFNYARIYQAAIERFNATGEFQEVGIKFGSGFFLNLVCTVDNVQLIRPFDNWYPDGKFPKIPVFLGIFSFVLPFLVLALCEILYF